MSSVFAIRDDDTSFFTAPDELETVYAPYWGVVPISLATVPFSGPEHRERSFNTDYCAEAELPLAENGVLVDWLKSKVQHRHVEIVLHGYNHRYKRIDGQWRGEYGWKPQKQLIEETIRGKTYLEALLGVDIQVFVPPSNTIGKAGIRAIRRAGLNLSGIMGRGGDRPFTWDYPSAYLKRWVWRMQYGDVYPYPLSYGGHTELAAYALTPRADAEYLLRSLEKCTRIRAPFVLATHYWEFAECPKMHDILSQLIGCAMRLGMTFGPITSCFGKTYEH